MLAISCDIQTHFYGILWRWCIISSVLCIGDQLRYIQCVFICSFDIWSCWFVTHAYIYASYFIQKPVKITMDQAYYLCIICGDHVCIYLLCTYKSISCIFVYLYIKYLFICVNITSVNSSISCSILYHIKYIYLVVETVACVKIKYILYIDIIAVSVFN